MGNWESNDSQNYQEIYWAKKSNFEKSKLLKELREQLYYSAALVSSVIGASSASATGASTATATGASTTLRTTG